MLEGFRYLSSLYELYQSINELLLRILDKSFKPKQVTFSWISIYLHILHGVHVTMSVLLAFLQVCITNSFNRIFKPFLGLYVVHERNQQDYFNGMMSRKYVWQYLVIAYWSVIYFCPVFLVLHQWHKVLSCLQGVLCYRPKYEQSEQQYTLSWLSTCCCVCTEILSSCCLVVSMVFLWIAVLSTEFIVTEKSGF